MRLSSRICHHGDTVTALNCFAKQREGKKYPAFSRLLTFQSATRASHNQKAKGAGKCSLSALAYGSLWQRRGRVGI